MTDPILDFRSTDAFYQQALALARTYTPDWTDPWSTQEPDAQQVNQDPGLVLLKLFALLGRYIGQMQNQVPHQRKLAFYQFLDMQLRPPLAAQAPLAFTLQAEQPPCAIPADTVVSNSDDPLMAFQTNEALEVVPATLSALLTMIPSQDRYIDVFDAMGKGQPIPLFLAGQDSQQELPLSHWFMLGDPQLFKPDPSLQRITVHLSGARLAAEYFEQWADGALAPLAATVIGTIGDLDLSIEVTQAPTAGPLTLTQLEAELYQADGRSSGFAGNPDADAEQPMYWLLVRPAPTLRVVNALASELPSVSALSCTLSGDGIQPEQAACGTVIVNLRNGVYPFGQTPAVEDAFYICSDNLFVRQGAQITLNFALSYVTTDYPVTLYWQYWDGSTWQSLNATPTQIGTYHFIDTTNALRGNPLGASYVQFLCPAMQRTTVAGAEGYWLRVVIAAGGYGEIGAITTQAVSTTIDQIPDSILPPEQKQQVTDYLNNVEGVNFSYTYTPSSYAPPYIQSLCLSYAYTATPQSLWTYNAFALEAFRHSPFKPVTDRYTSCYLGFSPQDFVRYTLGRGLSLYFYLSREYDLPAPTQQWEYYDGAAWQALSIDDGTKGLTRSGIVRFTVPDDLIAATLYSQDACWLRILNPYPRQDVDVYGIYPNAAMAGNRSTVLSEILGSSNEQPSQSFELSYTPVLQGLQLDVIEPAGMEPAPAPDDGDALSFSVTPSATSAGGSDTTARRWTQVENFCFYGPTDRVYTLNSENGRVTFGDGYNGMIPPAGYNNIVASHYEYTQGIAGNVAAGKLSVLREGFSAIAAVNNPAPAQGGVNGDSVGDLEAAAPTQTKANDRAVQLDDLGTLARAASSMVSRARAVVTPDQRIAIGVLALSDAPRPYAPPALLDQVTAYVRARCLAPLAPRIGSCGPSYVAIDVVAQVAADVPSDQSNATQQDLAAQLQAFFQPVFGGPDGQGWAFGQTVQAAQVTRMLRKDKRVGAVLGIALNGVQNGNVPLAPDQLPVAGTMSVLVYATGAGR
ncbi:hypothetical protein EO087_14230 [Dyella sp. M7H15-1]|uniref:hypothetical protein n=1 Tax=Dyella sp. M7H15-1 TaxID=2501295 RepID=UPI0010050B7A|nr:hypothetical protein [Dyella sp. M7H15-1]QAU25011.1 hypothetical protein EO087_14230 [Dyella sp. M7H15-1]